MLLLAALVLGLIPGAVPGVERLAAGFVAHRDYAAWVLHGRHVGLPVVPPSHVSVDDYLYGSPPSPARSSPPGSGCSGGRLRESLPGYVQNRTGARWLSCAACTTGHIGDYIAWWSAGASLVGGVCLIALR